MHATLSGSAFGRDRMIWKDGLKDDEQSDGSISVRRSAKVGQRDGGLEDRSHQCQCKVRYVLYYYRFNVLPYMPP
jgi:hypothetical protein